MLYDNFLEFFFGVCLPFCAILLSCLLFFVLRRTYTRRYQSNVQRHLTTMPRKKEFHMPQPTEPTSNILSFKLLDRFYQQQLTLPYRYERTEEYLRNLPTREVTGNPSPPAYAEINLNSPSPMLVVTQPASPPPSYSSPKAP